MPISRQKKVEIVGELGKKIKDANGVVFVSFKGLTVADANSLRRSLEKDGTGYSVVKKTLLKKILTEAGIAGEVPVAESEMAVVYGNDALLPAKGVATFLKKNEEKMSFVGGILEGKIIGAAEVTALSRLPGKQELYGQLVGLMLSPIRGFATVLSQVPGSFAVVLNEIAKKKEVPA